MKITFTLLIIFICGIGIFAQTGSRPRSVSGNQSQILISDNARFEIFSFSQTQLTIKLDRYTGKTFLYYVEGKRRWFLMEVRGGLPDESKNTIPKYEIIGEGDATFLFNNETGQSWILNLRTWEPVVD